MKVDDSKEATFFSEDTETDTEAETALTEQEYKDSIEWKVGQIKPKTTKVKKTRAEMIKRIFVGFFVLALYINSYLVSTLTMTLMPFVLMMVASSELLDLNRNPVKDRQSGTKRREWLIVILG